MAHPDCDNGFTKIANELLCALARHNFSATERRLLDTIIAKTYGWNKKTDHISYSQFIEYTQLKDPRNVWRTLKKLAQRNIITANLNGTRTIVYGIQKDYDLWDSIAIVNSDDINPDDSAIVKPDDIIPNDIISNDINPDEKLSSIQTSIYRQNRRIQKTLINKERKHPNNTENKEIKNTKVGKAVNEMLIGNTSEIIAELRKLPNWKSSNDEEWVGEIISEFPDTLTITLIRDCRDYHLETHPNKKHIWRTAIRNWIKKESAFRKEDQLKKGKPSQGYKELP